MKVFTLAMLYFIALWGLLLGTLVSFSIYGLFFGSIILTSSTLLLNLAYIIHKHPLTKGLLYYGYTCSTLSILFLLGLILF